MTGRKFPLQSIVPLGLGFALIVGLGLPATGLADSAFLKTAHTLNGEFRDYCLDVFGHTPNINIDAPLRLHSCKYGENSDDQQFGWVGNGQISAPVFDLCVVAETLAPGGELYIEECADITAQSWTIGPQGEISPASRPDLCLTIGSEYHLAGAPPWISPGYYARETDLQLCSDSERIHKEFRWGLLDGQQRTDADTLGREMPMELAAQIREIVSRGAGAQETSALYADQPRVYEPGEVEVAENLAYGPHEQHRLDVHTDNHRYGDTPMPVVMYFHGGGFVRGSRAGSRNVADYFASLGLVGVNATYRLAPEAKWPAGAEDVGAAVAWVKENIRDYGGDPNQIFVIGKSAAAAHVATYAFRPEILAADAPAAAGVVLISGTYNADSATAADGRIAYFGEDFSVWPRISTLGNIERVDIPVLISISDFDSATTKASFVDLVRELTVEHNQMPRVVQLIGHDHFSSNPSIGTQDTQLSAEILQLIRSTAGAYQPMSAR